MPELGEIKRSFEIGQKGYKYRKWIWSACEDCGKERWSILKYGLPQSFKCNKCGHKKARGAGNPKWKGGKQRTGYGYIHIQLTTDDFFYPMADNRGRVFEHRLVMAKHLKRCLLPWEVVHHKNGVRDDNRIENLQILSNQIYHIVDSHIKTYIKKLEKRIVLLEDENKFLRDKT